MSKVNLYFSTKEKIDFLEKLGYTVVEEKVRMAEPCYHNDMRYWNAKVLIPYKNNQRARNKPGGYSFNKEDWLDQIFNAKFKKFILNLMMKEEVEE